VRIISTSRRSPAAQNSRTTVSASRVVRLWHYGERTGRLEGPFGHVWQISTRIENVSPGEMQRCFQDCLT
jgi:hypothetical protein